MLNVVKLDWMDINVLVKDVGSLGANRCHRWQCIHLEFLVANLLDFMAEQVLPTVAFMLVDFVGAWDQRRTHKGTLLGHTVVVNSLVIGNYLGSETPWTWRTRSTTRSCIAYGAAERL